MESNTPGYKYEQGFKSEVFILDYGNTHKVEYWSVVDVGLWWLLHLSTCTSSVLWLKGREIALRGNLFTETYSYLRKVWRKLRKFRWLSARWVRNLHLLSTSFVSRNSQPLVCQTLCVGFIYFYKCDTTTDSIRRWYI